MGVGVRLLRRDLRPAGRHLELVGTLALGPGKQLQLVRALNGMYLIGCADKELSLLAAIPADQAAALVQRELMAGRSRAARRRARSGATGETSVPTGLDFRRELGTAMAERGVQEVAK
jgi:flagellar biogenesis protein FliO